MALGHLSKWVIAGLKFKFCMFLLQNIAVMSDPTINKTMLHSFVWLCVSHMFFLLLLLAIEAFSEHSFILMVNKDDYISIYRVCMLPLCIVSRSCVCHKSYSYWIVAGGSFLIMEYIEQKLVYRLQTSLGGSRCAIQR